MCGSTEFDALELVGLPAGTASGVRFIEVMRRGGFIAREEQWRVQRGRVPLDRLPGVPLAEIPFDGRLGVICNDGGRVIDEDGGTCAGEHATGWIKRGPPGVIGTNKKDSPRHR
jgi:NADPH-dependent glutamate synthase beta subunit-like oxidoreductase